MQGGCPSSTGWLGLGADPMGNGVSWPELGNLMFSETQERAALAQPFFLLKLVLVLIKTLIKRLFCLKGSFCSHSGTFRL